ncbi:MAG TPA: SpoIIE family protein phosphatase [Thermoanaerobaculia bacterium]|jgi:serine phosphatase RsbU (regulator of sigma subunit)
MKIRTQLIVAAFFLAVLPLAAIVTYSYHSSRTALESAYRKEADRVTRQMDRRLAGIRNDLEQRLAVVSNLPIQQQAAKGSMGNIVSAMGDAATFVDALEFQPVTPPAPARRVQRTLVAPADPPKPPKRRVALAGEGEAEAEAGFDTGIDAQMDALDLEPIIIDLPAPPPPIKYVMSEEQQKAINELSRLGASLANPKLTDEQRQAITAKMQEAERTLQQASAIRDREYAAKVAKANTAFSENVTSLQEEADARRERLHEIHQERLQQRAERRGEARTIPAPGVAPAPPSAPRIRTLSDVERRQVREAVKKTELILGRHFKTAVKKEGNVVGQVTAKVSPEEVIQRVLGTGSDDDKSEVPFAVDREGNVYTRNEGDRVRLAALAIPERVRAGRPLGDIAGWIVTTTTDPQSGLRIGVARQVGDNLAGLRATAARNFGFGMGLIAFALIGIVPLANHLTRDVHSVAAGAERIAQGDLMTRLPVKSKNELGQLALAFNRMAEDLSIHQQKLLEGERTRKEQELQQKLMAVEYERKSFELEEARRFQLSMLPKEVPRHPAYDVAVYTRTATEVGGDYYDFHLEGDVLSTTIGDATGHGAKAGTMVTVVKTLFSGYVAHTEPAAFLGDAAEKIKRMELGRMSMALSLARFEGSRLTLATAGMPPALVHRAETNSVEELAHGATPLGTLGHTYEQTMTTLSPGDTVLLMSDGFPELMNDEGEQLGYAASAEAFARAAAAPDADRVIARLASFAEEWHGDTAPNDDVTFVVVRMRD